MKLTYLNKSPPHRNQNQRRLVIAPSTSIVAMANSILALTLLFAAMCVGISECSSSKEAGGLGYDPKDLASDQTLSQAFQRWLAKHGRNYVHDVDEQQSRFQIFKQNLQYIHSHNQRNLSYSLGLNQFADLSNEEFKRSYLGGIFHPINTSSSVRYHYSAEEDELPESVDWTAKGAVTPVKDQGQCGGGILFIQNLIGYMRFV